MKTGSGRFRTPVVIQKPRTATDAVNHADLSVDANWEDVASDRAAFQTRGGSESRVFDQIQAETTHLIELRSSPISRSIIPTWRLRIGHRKFNVRAAYEVDERGRLLRIEATEAR